MPGPLIDQGGGGGMLVETFVFVHWCSITAHILALSPRCTKAAFTNPVSDSLPSNLLGNSKAHEPANAADGV